MAVKNRTEKSSSERRKFRFAIILNLMLLAWGKKGVATQALNRRWKFELN